MRFFPAVILGLLALARTAAATDERLVFAHYMLGLTSGQTLAQWELDIAQAKSAGIDGFALNAGPSDPYGDQQLALAYQAAEAAGFKVFVSFDMACCGPWDIDKIVQWINQYKGSSAQYKVDSRPFVSTFEGPSFADSWASVRSQTGGLHLVPDWSSLGPHGIQQHLGKIDGAFSWDAWGPSNNPGPKTTDADIAYLSVLGPKSYMMGVSPFFYTNIPEYNKNWLWGPDTLWYDRWEQVLDLLPDFVQIISWNDYGESHHICSLRESAIIPPAKPYASGIPHDGLRFVLPYYITAYKAGNRNVPIAQDGAVFWYRTSPRFAGSDGGTRLGPNGAQSATAAVEDAVFVLALAASDAVGASVDVSIGGNLRSVPVAAGRGPKMVKVPFDGRTGPVRVCFRDKCGVGARDIQAQAPSGRVNFNPVVGLADVASASPSSYPSRARQRSGGLDWTGL